ncbi:MAG: cytochrome c peroxidase [Gammaproteobacteria bacterium]
MKFFRYFLMTAGVALMLTLPHLSDAFETMPALPEQPPIPSDNPMSPAKVMLGKQIYFDPHLSFNRKISCNSCHDLDKGGVDHRRRSTGARSKQPRRSTPTVLNAAFQSVQFWDGRADSLEAAIKEHLLDDTIMGMQDKHAVLKRIGASADYRRAFNKAFLEPNLPSHDAPSLNYDNIAKALAAYLRTLITPNSAFDRYVRGDKQALSQQALRGMEAFQSVGCVACHFGTNFSGPPMPMGEGFYELFPNYLGSVYDKKYNLVTRDQGRYEVTKDTIHRRLFRVPSLRNVALTAPYFHTGTVAALEDAVRVMAKTELDKEISDREAVDIVVFLKALSGELPKQRDQ